MHYFEDSQIQVCNDKPRAKKQKNDKKAQNSNAFGAKELNLMVTPELRAWTAQCKILFNRKYYNTNLSLQFNWMNAH